MKKFLYTFIVLVGFATVGFSQGRMNVAASEGKEALAASKVSGDYVFTLPASVTQEMVTKNATYYTSYFSVSFDAATHKASIHMVYNEGQSRSVIIRFLSSCGVDHVGVDGENVVMYDFLSKYLQ